MNFGSFLKKLTGSIDLSVALPALAKLTRNKTIESAGVLYNTILKPLVDEAKKQQTAAESSVTTPSTSPVAPPAPLPPIAPTSGIPAPQVAPVPHVTPASRVISRLIGDHTEGLYYIREVPEGKDTDAPIQIVDKARFDDILSGSAIGERAAVTCDWTPVDQHGNEVGPGDPLLDSANLQVVTEVEFDGQVYDQTKQEGPIEIHSYDDDHGCTPVLKVPKGTRLAGRHTLRARGVWGDKDSATGRLETPWTPVIYIS